MLVHFIDKSEHSLFDFESINGIVNFLAIKSQKLHA